MENEDEYLYKIILDAGIDVSLHMIHNPTESFMINIATEYFKRFQFDGDEIAKPTPEQLNRVSCEESALNAIEAINLHAALTKICDEIFLKDFTLTDITNPGYKRTIKKIKVLFNFYLYVKSKKIEKEHLFDELENRYKEIQNFIARKEEFIAKTGSIIHDREMKFEYKEKLKKEIEQLKNLMEKDQKKSEALQQNINQIKSEHRQSLKKVNDSKAKLHEMHKITKDLQNKIVASPEEYIDRKRELENVMKEKMEERQILHDCINGKKAQIEKNGLSECMIQECHEKAKDTMDIVKKLKETTAKLITTKRLLSELNEEIVMLESRSSNTRISILPEDLDLEENQRLLSLLHNQQVEKQRDLDTLKKKLEDSYNEQSKLKGQLQKEKQITIVAEREYVKLMQEYKIHFENELTEEYAFRKDLNKFVKN
ncbi:uncharacterized protein LOC131672773 [Phymastichus coffea]|uniref:uncharacterized protein LOC131672773 n=1 Tax=Phymastichus coffea TaxID=108790 RepID=UPI00273B74A5|nr:uncharacterized protein LOC131672773 [Phymastichus coffea]XP_058806207.1 uncharacterized protein LOC131672773 [Phymastichus coffea]XP_058806208.1 uncharacterized protein LOC131672773 [Phymastichus coffea]